MTLVSNFYDSLFTKFDTLLGVHGNARPKIVTGITCSWRFFCRRLRSATYSRLISCLTLSHLHVAEEQRPSMYGACNARHNLSPCLSPPTVTINWFLETPLWLVYARSALKHEPYITYDLFPLLILALVRTSGRNARERDSRGLPDGSGSSLHAIDARQDQPGPAITANSHPQRLRAAESTAALALPVQV